MKGIRSTAVVLTFLMLGLPPFASGMMFCCPSPGATSLRQKMADNEIALVGNVCRIDRDGKGSTEFHISQVLKSPSGFNRKKIIHLPLALPQYGTWLVFAEVFEGQLDVYDAMRLTPAALDYLHNLLALESDKRETILSYCFPHLEDADELVASDARKEFSQADAGEIASAARAFSPDKLRVWMKQPKLPSKRLNQYGRLLGYCGNDRDARMLDRLVRQRARSKHPEGDDGLFDGYILLNPRQGWACLREFLRDASLPFGYRYSLLRTLRFLHDTHPNIISDRELTAALGVLLDQADLADLSIEQLRAWRYWDLSDRVFALYSRRPPAEPIIRRAVIRYALRCPDLKAALFVAGVRREEPTFVAEMEEILTLQEESRQRP